MVLVTFCANCDHPEEKHDSDFEFCEVTQCDCDEFEVVDERTGQAVEDLPW